ncbi:MAG: DNA recombination protein RmuC [Bacteroidales bacterium]|nr:DNA recombination protein RmuC [Bacteroidales bacterium]
MLIEILLILAGLLLGFLLGFFIQRSRNVVLRANNETLKASSEQQRQTFDAELARQQSLADKHLHDTVDALKASQETQTAQLNEHFQQLLNEKSQAYTAALDAMERKHHAEEEALQTRFNETLDKMTAQLKVAADDMLKQRQREFSESSSENIGQLVEPLRATMEQMRQAMDANTKQQGVMGGEMRANVAQMIEQSKAAQSSTDELTRVLRHSNQAQGNFGEIVLEELLESQGLTKGVHYDTQQTLRDANGQAISTDDKHRLRPDVVLHLDSQRELIIDSKVSLSAYFDYMNADNETLKKEALKRHIQSIEDHVKELAKKDYASLVRPPKVSMGYVIMFMPQSSALWAALNAAPDLWRKAMEKNVYIADEQTLFAAVKIVQITWQQIQQAENHERVFELANEMVERVGIFLEHYQKVGKALETAQKAFDDGQKKLETQGQSIPQTARKLIDLGAQKSQKHPLPG